MSGTKAEQNNFFLSALFLVLVGAGVIPTSIRHDCLHRVFSFISSFFLSFVFYHFAAAREDKMFSENEIRNILFQVLSGLAFVHKHGKRLLLSFSFPFCFLKGLA